MKKLYEENMLEKYEDSPKDANDPPPQPRNDKRKRAASTGPPANADDLDSSEPVNAWAAKHDLRVMLTLMYILSFLCLLRSEEVVRLEWRMIKLEDDPSSPGSKRLRIELPFRKTHQYGGVCFIMFDFHYCLYLLSWARHPAILSLREPSQAISLSNQSLCTVGQAQQSKDNARLHFSQTDTKWGSE